MRARIRGPDGHEETGMETNVKAIELRDLWKRYKANGDPAAGKPCGAEKDGGKGAAPPARTYGR